MGKVSCEACNKGCKGQAIRLNNKYYHLKCFKCQDCQKPLAAGGFYTKENLHYCVEDYQRLFGTKCQICNQYVEGEVVTALGNTYHEECFCCTTCKKRFSSGDKVTYVGKDYLCNECLDRVTARVVIDDTDKTADIPMSMDDSDIKAKKPKPMPRGSTSAPTTPAKQDLSELRHLNGNLSTPALDVSTDVTELNMTGSLVSPAITNTSGYKSDDMSFDTTNYTVTNGDRSQDSIDIPVFVEPCRSPYRGRLSPIHNIMRYRSTSPAWSTTSRCSHKSKDSTESNGRTSRFDADYGKFYKSSYLEKSNDFRRGPSINHVGTSRENSPRHYHRPENFSYSQVRRDIVKPAKKGLLTMLGDREYLNTLKRFEPYKPDKAQEPIQLSKLPDGHMSDGCVAPIDRDDWPAPPDPAAAYPELLRRHDRVTVRSKSADADHVDGVNGKENVSENNGYVNVKMEKEIQELSKMTDSGAAKVILEDLKKKQLEKSVLDPRSASRTPSAAVEPPYRPRYDSPIFASPSRDIDQRQRLRSFDCLTERKYRTAALPFSNIPIDWQSYELPKNLVRKQEVLKPGYTLTARSPNINNQYCFDGLDVAQLERPVSSAGELHVNIYSSQLSVDEFDPTTGLKKNVRCRSATLSEGAMSPYWGYRRSVPNLFKTEESTKVYTYEQLRHMMDSGQFALGVDKETLERYMSRAEFEMVLGMPCEEFYRLAEWRRNDLKMRVGLY